MNENNVSSELAISYGGTSVSIPAEPMSKEALERVCWGSLLVIASVSILGILYRK